MEWFKVGAGSWAYPEPGFFKLMEVPLFSGFMYATVGSYMARVIRIFDMRFAPYPPYWLTLVLAGAIYVNFAATLAVYARTRIWFRVTTRAWWMPLPVAAALSSVALWVAENVGTVTGTWLYSRQIPGQWVGLGKLGSWYLLLYVAFVTVTLVSRGGLSSTPAAPDQTNPRQTR